MALLLDNTNLPGSLEPQTEDEALDFIRELLESGRGKEAQHSAARWAKQFPDSAKLAKWDDVLNFQHSEWRKGTYHDHRADDAWIRENGHKYPGQWMALRDGQLIAMDAKIATVRRRVRELGVNPKGTLLWFQPGKRPE
jgi:hypothetical protein